ncbi:hypothetical protein O181_046315 [Austropuccinia psidii MF-1]|uniref:Uncharacterized protein n=1 Tax=Austropuccinia psidii MF-1 TaxID=1389203 RepID=A0A9Q3DT38_9BASI|nr:hypothetical protein [Austropuccinia psidii MF-1]
MASGHILLSLALWENPPPHQPRGQFLCFAPGGPSGLPWAFGPSSHHQGLWAHPFDHGGFELNGLLGHLDPLWALWSISRRLHTVGPLGPSWPKSNEANHLPPTPGGLQTTSEPT